MKKSVLIVFINFISFAAFCQCSVTTTQQNAYCGFCNGSATAIPTGTAPFIYSWSNGQTSQTDTALCQGLYTVTVTDANACTSSATVSIQNNTGGVIPTITNATCNGCCDGTAMVSPYGGCPPYTYIWNTGQTTDSIGGLCAGNYLVQVSDSCGCVFAVIIPITEPPAGISNSGKDNLVISITPNPSIGIFFLNKPDELNSSRIQINDLFGKIIYLSDISATTTAIDLSQNADGIYFYFILDNNNIEIASGKLIVVNK